MKSKLLLGLLFIVACTALWSSDRMLRRLMRMDTVVLQGQTGLSWIDELFAKRTAQQAELAKLQSGVAAAKTPEQRVVASMAIADFEVKWHRPASRRRLQALHEVIAVGGNLPQSATAYRELIQNAQGAEDFTEGRKLLEAYVTMIRRMPASQDKLLRLLESWKFSSDLQWKELELNLLESIRAEFPVAVEAMGAYETLRSKYRELGKREQMPEVEKSIEETRVLAVRISHEEELSKDIGECLKQKDCKKAEATFFTMTPGLSTKMNYWELFSKILTLIQTTPTAGIGAAKQMILKASQVFTAKAMNADQQATLFLSAAFLDSQMDQWKEAQTNLSRAPPVDRLNLWRQYIQTRCWLAGYAEAPAGLPTFTVSRSAGPAVKSPENMTAFYMKQGTNTVLAAPATRWNLKCDETSATLDVQCVETEPGKMVAQKTQRDSNVWEDDCIEIYVMTVRGDANMVQVIANTKGVYTDLFFKPEQALLPTGMTFDVKWNSNIQVKMVPFKDGWAVRFTIPWRDVGVRYPDGACFLNVRRLRYVTGKLEVFSWTELGLANRDPGSLGLVIFPNKKAAPAAVKP